MNAPSWDIKEMLEVYDGSSDSSGDGLGLVYGRNLFRSREPSSPDVCVTIYDTEGYPDWLGLTDVGYEYPSIQIRVRHRKYDDGMALIRRIKDALHGRAQETWNDTLYCLIRQTSGPAMLDWDDNGRVHFVCNFNIQRRAV